MEYRSEVACVWSGAVFCVVFGIGFMLLANFVPPPSPALDARGIAAVFIENRTMILSGSVLCMIASGFYLTWTAVISHLMWRARFRLWSMVQLLSGGVGSLGPLIATMLWVAASFRPERDPEAILAISDVAWLFTLFYFVPIFFQFVAVGIVGLMASGDLRPWPRWMGYLSLWFALLAVPASVIPFFKMGPFAWDGLFGFWVPLVAFFGWFVVMIPLLLATVRRQAAETPRPGQRPA